MENISPRTTTTREEGAITGTLVEEEEEEEEGAITGTLVEEEEEEEEGAITGTLVEEEEEEEGAITGTLVEEEEEEGVTTGTLVEEEEEEGEITGTLVEEEVEEEEEEGVITGTLVEEEVEEEEEEGVITGTLVEEEVEEEEEEGVITGTLVEEEVEEEAEREITGTLVEEEVEEEEEGVITDTLEEEEEEEEEETGDLINTKKAPGRFAGRSCPLCPKVVIGFSQHLRYTHNVRNTEERVLLCNWRSGRVNIRQQPCPVTGCSTRLSRLDRHMESHTELNRSQRRRAIQELRRRLTMERLAALRASNPVVPLTTRLDIVEGETKQEDHSVDLPLPPLKEEEEKKDVSCKDYSCHCRASILRLRKALQERDEALTKRSATNQSVREDNLKLTKRSATDQSVREDNLKLISELNRVRKRYQLLKRQSVRARSAKARSAKRSRFQPEPSPPTSDTEQEELQQHRVVGSEAQTEEATAPGSSSQSPFPGSALSVFIEGFRKTCEGPNPNNKLKQNCDAKLKPVQHFLKDMAKDEINPSTLTFLTNQDNMRRWFQTLQKNMAVTTVNHYTSTIGAFLQYSEETPPPGCRLTRNHWREINRAMMEINKSVKGSVDNKKGKVVSIKSLMKCRSLARDKIPQVLKTLKETKTQTNQNRFYGFLCAYFTSMYGHSPGLYRNMMVKEVEEVQWSLSGAYLINVGNAKQMQTTIQMSLDKEEYSWFRDFLKVKRSLPGGKKDQFFFFNSTNTEIKNLPVYLREAWKEMGLPDSPSFTDLRTSVVSHVKNVLSNADGEMLADFMCHDSQMEDKRYATNPSGETSAFLETASKGEDTAPRAPPGRTNPPEKESGRRKRTRCSTRSLTRPPGRSRNGRPDKL
ncbi:uncharacterized protein LOC120041360 [Salvelinus namaycush]|uniref:Uncharacterized protein LOC120041360 n=1 Tax=Salvelinus namaycush TaxID=8040 RepID=A0A8U0QFL3_SALNM|nr:uncharacterized protein LOC120041360 [Salvelinus namaycush]